jgi:hypothetical protein
VVIEPGCFMAASESGKIADLHQHSAEIPSILLPGSLLKMGNAGLADHAQSVLLTHGNFFRSRNVN